MSETRIIKCCPSFTMVDNRILRDPNLDCRDIGLYTKLNSFPDTWKFSERGLASIMKDGYTTIHTGILNLEKYGYLKRIRTRTKQGTLGESIWLITNVPFEFSLSQEKIEELEAASVPPRKSKKKKKQNELNEEANDINTETREKPSDEKNETREIKEEKAEESKRDEKESPNSENPNLVNLENFSSPNSGFPNLEKPNQEKPNSENLEQYNNIIHNNITKKDNKDSTPDPSCIVSLYNEAAKDLVPQKNVSKTIKDLMEKLPYTYEEYRGIFQRANESKFLTGNVSNFKAELVWVLKHADEITKGKYDDFKINRERKHDTSGMGKGNKFNNFESRQYTNEFYNALEKFLINPDSLKESEREALNKRY